MVEAMIKNARAAEQSVIAYWKKLKPFYPDHPEAPLWMACLAAFPVGITIDLLYQLWANFRELKDLKGKTYQLPPLVVNDCILSPLFRISGKDIYEMPSDTRAFLLNVFKQIFGEEIIGDLASFLHKYIQEKKITDFPINFYNAQEWTALLAVDPKQAAMNILTSLRSKLEEGQLQSIGVTNLLTTLVKENHDLAEMLRKAIDKKHHHEEINIVNEPAVEYKAANRFNKNINIRPATTETGITIDIPATLSNTLMPLYKAGVGETLFGGDTEKQGVVYAVLVATTASQVEWQEIRDFSYVLKNKRLVERVNTYTLYNESATYANVTAVLQKVLSQVSTDDTVFFCFMGDVVNEEGLTHLVLQDSMYERVPTNDSPYSRGIGKTLTNHEFSDLVSLYATGSPSCVLILDAVNCTPWDWLPQDYPKHIVITGEEDFEPSGITSGLIRALIKLFSASKQNLTYKEIFSHLLTVENQVPRVIIQPEFLDEYFLTFLKQSPVLQNQQLLSKLGYSLFIDGKEGPQYQKVLEDFKTKFGISNEQNIQTELQRAVQLKDRSLIQTFYVTVNEERLDKGSNWPGFVTPLTSKKLEIEKRIQDTSRATFTHAELKHFRDISKYRANRSIFFNHLILIGINRDLVNDPLRMAELKTFLLIASYLHRCIYFVLEEPCNWQQTPFINYTVLPSSLQPVNEDRSLENMLRELESIIADLEKYLLPEHPSADLSVVEQRIREARKTKELNLSELSMQEIPPAVFQLEGLESLDLSNNNLATLPENIGQLHTLRKVNLSRNPIEYLPEYSILLQLEVLDIRETRVERLPRSIGQLSNLRSLRLDHSQIKVLPIGAFLNKLPRELTYEGLNLLNINTAAGSTASLAEYFKPVHNKEFAILEIHSEHALPHFDTVPGDITNKVHYGFYSQLNTLQELFKVIYTEAGAKHTIVYLCDEKNILSPQFGNESERHNLIYQYWRAFGKPLNLIINNPGMYSGAFADLAGAGELNFVAVRNDTRFKGGAFPALFFKTIWQQDKKGFDKRMSLSNTLKYLEQEQIKKNMELGYHSYINPEKLQDFSFPLGKRKPANKPALKTKNKPTPKPSPRREPPEMKAFNGQWVLVVGSGNEHLEQSEMLCALAVGNMLAVQGYGLICGGWPGVDYFVSQAFQEVYAANKKSVKSSLLTVMNPGQKPYTEGKHIRQKTTEWNEYALKKAFVVIVIGGASLTLSTYEYARKKQIPVIPIPGTHKAAGRIYNNLKKDRPHLYSIELLRSMEATVETEEKAEGYAWLIREALLQLAGNRADNDPTPAFEELVEDLYRSSRVVVRDDLQKERWGGKSKDEGLKMSATVSRTFTTGWFNVHITLKAEGKRPFYGEVAFFLHDSFGDEIRYCIVKNGQASLHVVAFESFTIGAYTDEGIFLELDLQEQKGYPKEFYKEKKPAKQRSQPPIPVKSKKKVMLKKYIKRKK